MPTMINGGASIDGASNVFNTGDIDYKARVSTPAGWIPANGSTIGSPASGATRANNDTLALFTLWWTDYSDAILPMLTSAGGVSSRGASAAADWAANKRMTVFDLRDDFIRGASATNVNGVRFAEGIKDHQHAIPVTGSTGGGTNARFTYSGANDGPVNLFTLTTVGAAGETRPRGMPFPAFIKL